MFFVYFRSVIEVLQNNRHKNKRILPIKTKDLLNLKHVEMVAEENGTKTSFVRKNKLKKRNTQEEKVIK